MLLFRFLKREYGLKKWSEISEDELYNDIYKENKQASSFIRTMLNGNDIICDNFEYRIEVKGDTL